MDFTCCQLRQSAGYERPAPANAPVRRDLSLETCPRRQALPLRADAPRPAEAPGPSCACAGRQRRREASADARRHVAALGAHDLRYAGPAADGLRLRIVDDGIGFDVPAIRVDPRRGIGMRNMRERVESIGGSFTIDSRPGRTAVLADLPQRAIERLREPVQEAA